MIFCKTLEDHSYKQDSSEDPFNGPLTPKILLSEGLDKHWEGHKYMFGHRYYTYMPRLLCDIHKNIKRYILAYSHIIEYLLKARCMGFLFL